MVAPFGGVHRCCTRRRRRLRPRPNVMRWARGNQGRIRPISIGLQRRTMLGRRRRFGIGSVAERRPTQDVGRDHRRRRSRFVRFRRRAGRRVLHDLAVGRQRQRHDPAGAAQRPWQWPIRPPTISRSTRPLPGGYHPLPTCPENIAHTQPHGRPFLARPLQIISTCLILLLCPSHPGRTAACRTTPHGIWL